jgi:predicted GTPase
LESIQDDFFDGAAVIVFIFTIDRYSSFMNLKSWLKLIPRKKTIKYYLIANKIDSVNRVVVEKQAQQFAKTYNMSYYEVSALTGQGFEEFKEDLFKTIEYEFITKDKD